MRLFRTLALTAVAAIALAGPAKAFDDDLTTATNAILVDLSSNTVLYAKNADERMPTSSMSKLMTAWMVFDQLKSGRLTLDRSFPVSKRAYDRNGSDTFLEIGQRVEVQDLLRGMLIQSGNDASITLAEGVGVSEDRFARRMTQKARDELGMEKSNFTNATGWPDPENWEKGQPLNHYSTARDLSKLATAIIRDFPEYYKMSAETEFTFNGIRQTNRNPLLYINGLGADGLKTGHTKAAGYGLVASAVRDGRRLVLVVNGLPTSKARGLEAERLINWGFAEFSQVTAVRPGQKAGELAVHLGAKPSVPVVTDGALSLTVHVDARDRLEYELTAKSPLPAPVKAGDKVGILAVYPPGGKEPIGTVPVVAAESVGKTDFVGNFFSALKYMISDRAPVQELAE